MIRAIDQYMVSVLSSWRRVEKFTFFTFLILHVLGLQAYTMLGSNCSSKIEKGCGDGSLSKALAVQCEALSLHLQNEPVRNGSVYLESLCLWWDGRYRRIPERHWPRQPVVNNSEWQKETQYQGEKDWAWGFALNFHQLTMAHMPTFTQTYTHI